MGFSIEQTVARQCIERAVNMYSRGLDRLDPDLMKQAYWPDAVDERFDGDIDGYVAEAMRTHEPFAWTMHALHNHVVEFDSTGDTARGELYVVAYLEAVDPPVLNTFYGRYLDTYSRRGGDWRISRRACVHEGSQAVPSTPTPWSFATQRSGTADRPPTRPEVGP
ncbi:MAG TPA: nuclear transport factor 2 family protein [Ilumatobacteraceae bacterium]